MTLVDMGPPELGAERLRKSYARAPRPLAARLKSMRDLGLIILAWAASWAVVVLAIFGVLRLI